MMTLLEFIFRDFWHWSGSVVLILAVGIMFRGWR